MHERTLWRAGLLALAIGGIVAPSAAQQAGVAPDWPLRDSARVALGRELMVVSGHPLASRVGRAILLSGGNAVDAAVAVGLALAVVHPEAGNIGGGGFMMLRTANGEVYALDYRERAPRAAQRDMFIGRDGNPTEESVIGHRAAGVPGSVAGLAEAHRRFGSLPWAQLAEPALRLARDGFLIDDYRHQSIASGARRLRRFPASARQFLPGGESPAVGSLFRQPDLARTLAAIGAHGADGFYRGSVAQLIVEEMRRGRGLITAADLAEYRAEWREPIRVSYRGHSIYSMPPASSGGATLALILNQVAGFSPLPPFGSVRLLHLEAEAMRRAFEERNASLGDPGFVDNPLARMTSKDHAALRRQEIDAARATPIDVAPLREGPSTTHYSIVDALGNAVSITTTLNFSYGSAVTVTGAGFLLNDEMDDFTTAPGKPNNYGLVQGEANAIAPGKRMLSAMTPTIVTDPVGRLLLVVGTPGGPTIITQVYHVLSNVIDHGMSLPEALAAPRTHHQALPDRIVAEEGGFPDAVLAGLRALGHTVETGRYMGDVEGIIRAERGWLGASDPRRGGGGAGR